MKGDLAIIEIHHRHGGRRRGETRANEIKDRERENNTTQICIANFIGERPTVVRLHGLNVNSRLKAQVPLFNV